MPIDEGFSSAFVPYFWIGNDRMGLAWTAESDQFWHPGPDRALELRVGPDESQLRIHLIAESSQITTPVTFSFALMATPVRPIPKNDPFAYPAYQASGDVTFSEFLTYPIPTGLSSDQGTIEFFVQRSSQETHANTALFSMGPINEGITAFLSPDGSAHSITLSQADPASPPLLSGKAIVGAERFTHLALLWDDAGLRLLADGELVGAATGTSADPFRTMITTEGARIRLGCNNAYQGYTGIVVDEVRISDVARDGAGIVPTSRSPFSVDEHTLLLDHLDDHFRPDGQDATTAGGGIPSIGSRFVPAQFDGGLRMVVAPARTGDQVLEDYGIRLFTHWQWQHDMLGYYGQPVLHDDTRVVPGLKQELAEAHRHGIKSIPYMAYPAISSTSGLVEQFADEWQILPVSRTPWTMAGAPAGYHFINSCVNARSYADYFAAGTAWVMDEHDFDGFYSDGLSNVIACQNEVHGCGYRDTEGRLHSTWPMFGVRETLKRMYRIVKERDPEGWVANHSSFNLLGTDALVL